MEENPTPIDSLFKKITEFLVTYIELLKLRSVEKATSAISTILPDLVVSILMLVFLLFINLGAAFWLGEVLGRSYFGFLLVGSFYLIVGFLFHFLLRGRIRKAAANYLIKRIFR